MKKNHFRDYRVWLWLIFGVGLALRLFRINLGFVEPAPNRQLIDAVMVREMYRGNFSFVQIQGLPLYHLMVAGLYYLHQGVNETYGRLLSVVFSALGAVWFWQLNQRYLQGVKALFALAFYFVLSPIHVVLSRGFQVDALTLALAIGGVLYLDKWFDQRCRRYFWLSVGMTMVAFLVKLSFGYFIFPLLFLWWREYRWGGWKQPRAWLYWGVIFGPVLWWYEYARQVNLRFAANEGLILDFYASSWFSAARLVDPRFYITIFYFWVQSVVTPIGAVLATFGLANLLAPKMRLYFWWLVGAMVSLILANQPAMTHEYYVLALVAPSAVLASLGVQKWKFSHLLGVVSLGVAILATWRGYALEIYRVAPRHTYVQATASKARALIPQESTIMATSYNSSVLWYYADRKGDYIRITAAVDQFEDMRKRLQAEYYLISDTAELDKNLKLKKHLESFDLLNPEDQDKFRIYRL